MLSCVGGWMGHWFNHTIVLGQGMRCAYLPHYPPLVVLRGDNGVRIFALCGCTGNKGMNHCHMVPHKTTVVLWGMGGDWGGLCCI